MECLATDPADDLGSLFTSILKQSEYACNKILNNVILQNEYKKQGSFNIAGGSQGGLIAR